MAILTSKELLDSSNQCIYVSVIYHLTIYETIFAYTYALNVHIEIRYLCLIFNDSVLYL